MWENFRYINEMIPINLVSYITMAGVFLPTTRSFIISNETNRKSETSGKKAGGVLVINFESDKQISGKMFTLHFVLLRNKILPSAWSQFYANLCQIAVIFFNITLTNFQLSFRNMKTSEISTHFFRAFFFIW